MRNMKHSKWFFAWVAAVCLIATCADAAGAEESAGLDNWNMSASEGQVVKTAEQERASSEIALGNDEIPRPAEEVNDPEDSLRENLVSGWNLKGDSWYLADENCSLLFGWQRLNGEWYWLDPETGAMVTGWLDNPEGRYYLSESGAMEVGWIFCDGLWYWADSSGALRSGWLFLNGSWYWLDADRAGAMAVGRFDADGGKYCAEQSGALAQREWVFSDGLWYFAQPSGLLLAGWLYDSGVWYWLDSFSCAMQTGWVDVAGSRYFLSSSGAMATGWVFLDGKWYWCSSSGAVQSGWLFDANKWYWLDPQTDGCMKVGLFDVGGLRYCANYSGAIAQSAWALYDGLWYVADSSGALLSGWQFVSGAWYWLDPSSKAMQTGLIDIDGVRYVLGSSGAMISDDWAILPNGSCGFAASSGEIVLDGRVGESGEIFISSTETPYTGWFDAADHSFYCVDGIVARGCWHEIEGSWFWFDERGVAASGWALVGGAWYYFDIFHAMQYGWLSDGGSWYYLDPLLGGAMRSSGWSWIGGVDYKFSSSGRMVGSWVDVPCLLQYPELPTGCESVALTNLLIYHGFSIGKTEIAARWLPRSSTNFVTAFAGNPFMSGVSYDGCVSPAIVNTANAFLSSRGSALRAYNVSGSSVAALYGYLSCGVPVQVWNTMYASSPGGPYASQWFEGHLYRLYGGNHAVVLQGYDEELGIVYVSDSLSGNVIRNAGSFLFAYQMMDSQALVIQ